MTWRERLALLLGAASPFALAHAAVALPIVKGVDFEPLRPVIDRDAWVYTDPAQKQRLLQLAGHSSHSSHASHSSHYSGSGGGGGGHASHYSGSGGVAPIYSESAPAVIAPAPPPPPPPAPKSQPKVRLAAPKFRPSAAPSGVTVLAPDGLDPNVVHKSARLTQLEIQNFVQRTQIALMLKGFDPGAADGTLSPKTREALMKFQAANGLPQTGQLDVDTLRRLGVIQ